MEISTEKIDCMIHAVPDLNIPLTPTDSFPLYITPSFPLWTTRTIPSSFPHQDMPLCESPKPIILSDKYYLPGRDLYILIGDAIFQVHCYFLTRNSGTICFKLEAAELDKDAPTRATQTDPICLHNKFTNARTFSLILSIIYNP